MELVNASEKLVGALVEQGLDDELSRLMMRRQSRGSAACESYDPETKHIREDFSWKAAPVTGELRNRVVDVMVPAAAPTEMLRSALLSDANGIQFDFDDAHCCDWSSTLKGYHNAFQVSNCLGAFKDVNANSCPLMIVRPRALHLPNPFSHVPGLRLPKYISECKSGALLDFAAFIWHCAPALLSNGRALCVYIAKIESGIEAQWWDSVFRVTENVMNLPSNTIKAIPLIENVQACLQTHEIVYYLRNRCVALNAGKWDYLFSYSKAFMHKSDRVLSASRKVASSNDFQPIKRYLETMASTCLVRSIQFTTGMAANLPRHNLPLDLLEKVSESISIGKTQERDIGSQGAIVADTRFIPVLKRAFCGISVPQRIPLFQPSLLFQGPTEVIFSEEDFKRSVKLLLLYIRAWVFDKIGFIVLDDCVEDLATAEGSRAQIAQWIAHKYISKSSLAQVTSNLVQELSNRNNGSQFVTSADILLLSVDPFNFQPWLPEILRQYISKIPSKM